MQEKEAAGSPNNELTPNPLPPLHHNSIKHSRAIALCVSHNSEYIRVAVHVDVGHVQCDGDHLTKFTPSDVSFRWDEWVYFVVMLEGVNHQLPLKVQLQIPVAFNRWLNYVKCTNISTSQLVADMRVRPNLSAHGAK